MAPALVAQETVTGTGLFDMSFIRTVVESTLAGSSGFENVALGAMPVETPVARSIGFVETTCGGTATVVKVQVTSAARALPATSFTRGSVAAPLTRTL